MNTIKLIESMQKNLLEKTYKTGNTLEESEGFKHFDSDEDITKEFGTFIKFTPDMIEYVGDGAKGKCKENSINANLNDPTNNPKVYLGYIILKDEEGKLIGIKHYWNVDEKGVIEHTPVREDELYNKGELQYYIGNEV